VARAHLPVGLLLGLAWLMGVAGGGTIPVALHLWTAAILVGTLALIWTERWVFPAPYDPQLRAGEARERGREPCPRAAQTWPGPP
jgi:hypothetical protein